MENEKTSTVRLGSAEHFEEVSSLTAADHKRGARAIEVATEGGVSRSANPLVLMAIQYGVKQLASLILKKVPAGKARNAAISGLQIVAMLCESAINGDDKVEQ